MRSAVAPAAHPALRAKAEIVNDLQNWRLKRGAALAIVKAVSAARPSLLASGSRQDVRDHDAKIADANLDFDIADAKVADLEVELEGAELGERVAAVEKSGKELRARNAVFSKRLIEKGVPARDELCWLKVEEAELSRLNTEHDRTCPEEKRIGAPGWDARYSPASLGVVKMVTRMVSVLKDAIKNSSSTFRPGGPESYEVVPKDFPTYPDAIPEFRPEFLHRKMEIPRIRWDDPPVSVPWHLKI